MIVVLVENGCSGVFGPVKYLIRVIVVLKNVKNERWTDVNNPNRLVNRWVSGEV